MSKPRHSPCSKSSIPRPLIASFLILSSIPGMLASWTITLGSIQIFRTHEWGHMTPTVYFYCKGEHKTVLPDVEEKHTVYTFKGEESWQPLTELPDKKCKRCGLYEKDKIKPDDVFDEWELCLGDFINGSYVHFKHQEFNATFICSECIANISSDATFTFSNAADAASEKMLTVSNSENVTSETLQAGSDSADSSISEKKLNLILEVIICVMVSAVLVAGIVSIHRHWQKRKRQQDQARFLKLFDDNDELDELEQF